MARVQAGALGRLRGWRAGAQGLPHPHPHARPHQELQAFLDLVRTTAVCKGWCGPVGEACGLGYG